jgi:hypothetical protein
MILLCLFQESKTIIFTCEDSKNHSWPSSLVIFSVPTRENNDQCRCQLTRWRGYNCKHKFGLRGNLREMDALGFHSRWSQSQIRWLEVLFQSQMTNSDDGKNKFRRSRDPGPKGKKIHGHELTEKSQTCCVRWIFIYNMVWICGGISIHPYMSHYINICRGISMSLNYYSRSL